MTKPGKKTKFDSGSIKFTLVPHGFQADIEVWIENADKTRTRIIKTSVCRDFGGDVGYGALLYLIGLAEDKGAFEKFAQGEMPPCRGKAKAGSPRSSRRTSSSKTRRTSKGYSRKSSGS